MCFQFFCVPFCLCLISIILFSILYFWQLPLWDLSHPSLVSYYLFQQFFYTLSLTLLDNLAGVLSFCSATSIHQAAGLSCHRHPLQRLTAISQFSNRLTSTFSLSAALYDTFPLQQIGESTTTLTPFIESVSIPTFSSQTPNPALPSLPLTLQREGKTVQGEMANNQTSRRGSNDWILARFVQVNFLILLQLM